MLLVRMIAVLGDIIESNSGSDTPVFAFREPHLGSAVEEGGVILARLHPVGFFRCSIT